MMLVALVVVVASCGKVEKNDETVVATVSGVNITYAEIKVDPLNLKVPEGGTLTDVQIADGVLKGEIDNLAKALRVSVVAAKIKELGITVNDAEISENFYSDVALAGMTDESVANIKKRKELIYDALVEYAKTPENADAIYLNKLSSVYAKNEWDLYKSVYDAKLDLSRFKPEANLPGSLDEMKSGMSESIKTKLIDYKLKKAIFTDIVITDDSVKEFYDGTVKGRDVAPEFDKVKNAIPVFLMTMYFFEQCKTCMEDWANREIQTEKVVIKDEGYRKFIKFK